MTLHASVVHQLPEKITASTHLHVPEIASFQHFLPGICDLYVSQRSECGSMWSFFIPQQLPRFLKPNKTASLPAASPTRIQPVRAQMLADSKPPASLMANPDTRTTFPVSSVLDISEIFPGFAHFHVCGFQMLLCGNRSIIVKVNISVKQ